MKKFLGIAMLAGCVFMANAANAETYYTVKDANATLKGEEANSIVNYNTVTQQYLDYLGVKILNANKIDKHIIFGTGSPLNYSIWGVKDDVTDSNRDLYQNRKVIVSKNLLAHATSDDEVAALVAHEIAHCLQSYKGPLRGSFHGIVYTVTARKQNRDADFTAMDLLANAGYNPVGLITILDKTAGQYRFDIGENILTTKRIYRAYNYIESKYPQFLKEYQNNPFFQNALLIMQPDK